VLRELRIENLLLIERAELRFGAGLNAITGETGAGKTILAHSLDLLMGGKARDGIVRPGAKEAYVEGVFEAPAAALADPQLAETIERLPGTIEVNGSTAELVLGRRVSAAGRTGAFVQSRSASAADLRALGSSLLAFYGQHEHRKLTLASAQMQILDGFAGDEHLRLLVEYRRAHASVVALTRELAELRERDGARERDLDLLRFELEEIEAAALDASEHETLTAERERLRHAEGLMSATGEGLTALVGSEDDGAAAGLAAATQALAPVQGVDSSLDAIADRLAGLDVELADIAGELRAYRDAVDGQPGRLADVEARLETIERLQRKHGGSVEAVLTHAERCATEIEQLENAEERDAELESRIAAAHETRSSLGGELSASRGKAARKLRKRVGDELAALAMEGATIDVLLTPHPDDFGPNGAETVELHLATNPGIPTAPLADAASGGELSRAMLALTGLGPSAGASTFVFDEIDAGIGGNTARAVGERLQRLADGSQVITITHLPQVASLASAHFRIRKLADQSPAIAHVDLVEGDELVAEITRMLGGEGTGEVATRHARELLAA